MLRNRNSKKVFHKVYFLTFFSVTVLQRFFGELISSDLEALIAVLIIITPPAPSEP